MDIRAKTRSPFYKGNQATQSIRNSTHFGIGKFAYFGFPINYDILGL